MVCFGEGHAMRGSDLSFTCQSPTCDYFTRKWRVYSLRRNGSHRAPIVQAIPKPITEQDKAHHPLQFYQYQNDTYQKNFSLLCLVTHNPDHPSNPNFYVTELRKASSSSDIGQQNLESLEAIGQSLHPCLIPSLKDETFTASQHAYANKHSIKQLEREDKSPLRILLHGIAIGERFLREDDARKDSLDQRQYNASFAASDLLRTSKGGCRRGSKFKDLISDHLNIAGVSDHVRDLLGFFGLCRSRTYLSLSEDKAVNEKIKQGWDPSGRGYGL